VDRLDRRKILIGTQAAAMLLAFILAVLVFSNTVQLWHVYVLSFLLGCVTAIDFPAQQTFIGDLAGMTEVRKAIVVNAMIFQTGRMIGPALAGVVVGALGTAMAFFLNGVSFIAVIISLIIVRAHQVHSPRTDSQVKAMLEGLRFIKSQPRVMDVIVFAVLVTFFGISLGNFFPALAGDVLKGDAQTLGLLMGASGGGALIGAMVVAPLVQSVRHVGRALALAVMWAGTWYIAVSASRSIPLSMACIFIVSLAMPAVMTTVNGLLQVLAPPKMRGRLLSAYIIVSFGIQPVAAVVIGFIANYFGTANAILFNGVAMIVGGLLMLTLRTELRGWEAPRPSDPVAVEAA
ncbi:MAG TPA: MFS transporter, partial [Anaerolineae bacterium]